MIRRFRAIIESTTEPEDHEILWYNKGDLFYWEHHKWKPFLDFDATEISYINDEDTSISTIGEALDKLLYVFPVIKNFTLKQSGTYERGFTINNLDFSWQYNKNIIKEQSLNCLGSTIKLPIEVRDYSLNKTITTNTSFILEMSDGKNTTSATKNINFIEYIYYGTKLKNNENTKKLKISPANKGLTITAKTNEYIWIFIPKSAGFTKIWYNNVDSTDDFTYKNHTYTSDTNIQVEGILYTSKNHSLNEVALKFT